MTFLDAFALKNANEFAEKGTVMHFAMRLGFMPHNEEQAEGILKSYMKELEDNIKDLEREKLFANSPVPVKTFEQGGKDANDTT